MPVVEKSRKRWQPQSGSQSKEESLYYSEVEPSAEIALLDYNTRLRSVDTASGAY